MADWFQLTLRFLQYGLVLGLFGWSGFRIVGLRGADWLSSEHGRMPAILAAVLALLVSIGLMPASIATMKDQPLARLDWPMIRAMTLSTNTGWRFPDAQRDHRQSTQQQQQQRACQHAPEGSTAARSQS